MKHAKRTEGTSRRLLKTEDLATEADLSKKDLSSVPVRYWGDCNMVGGWVVE